jgi:hypothetical protein
MVQTGLLLSDLDLDQAETLYCLAVPATWSASKPVKKEAVNTFHYKVQSNAQDCKYIYSTLPLTAVHHFGWIQCNIVQVYMLLLKPHI